MLVYKCNLDQHKVLIIDKNSVFDWAPGAYVMCAEPQNLKQNSVFMEKIAGQFQNPNISFK